VIVAGEAWIRNKGLTIDVSTPTQYFETLDTLPWSRQAAQEHVTRARKYAYHFFFRRMVPLPFMAPTGLPVPYRLNIGSLEELLPGVHPGLDIICDGILNAQPFVYPAEQLGVHDA
jgi:hypothetical protein